MLRISLPVFLIFFSALPGMSQKSLSISEENSTDNCKMLLAAQKYFVYNFYYQKVGGTNELINGKEYIPYYLRSTFKPILFNGKTPAASIIFKGREYKNIILEYDTYLDEVIYSDPTRFIYSRIYRIELNKDHIESFVLNFDNDSLLFRRIKARDAVNFNLPEGFYEVAWEGSGSYLIRHHSVIHEKDGIDEYFCKKENYIRIGNVYKEVSSSKEFLKLFGDEADMIRKFMRSSKIDIRRADKQQIVAVLRYYDTRVISNQ
jgi:hypothetical protein